MSVREVKNDLVGFHIIDGDFTDTLAVLVAGIFRESQALNGCRGGMASTESTTVADLISDADDRLFDGDGVHAFYSNKLEGMSRG